MEFLRDTNVTDDFGQTAYDLWVANGKSAPLAMDSMVIDIEVSDPCDINGDGQINGADLGSMLSQWGKCGDSAGCSGDLNGDNVVNGADLGLLLSCWG